MLSGPDYSFFQCVQDHSWVMQDMPSSVEFVPNIKNLLHFSYFLQSLNRTKNISSDVKSILAKAI